MIHAREENTESSGEGIDWKLVTDLPVAHLQEAVEKLKCKRPTNASLEELAKDLLKSRHGEAKS